MESHCSCKMRKKIVCVFILFLVLSVEITLGKSENKPNTKDNKHKINSQSKTNIFKRSPKSVYDFNWTRGKNSDSPYPQYQMDDTNSDNRNDGGESDQPFWGTRGRRESDSLETLNDEYPDLTLANKYCKNCKNYQQLPEFSNSGYLKERRDDPDSKLTQTRHSEDIEEENQSFVNVLDKHKPENPFWGARGRREDDEPFWGNRGRRNNNIFGKNYWDSEDLPFWSARGRREEIGPFWGNRGRREESKPFWGNLRRTEETDPFWGNRGRREKTEPFWGKTGRREEDEQFWGNRGRKIDLDPVLILGKQQSQLRNYIRKAFDTVEDELETLSRLRRSKDMPESYFWKSNGRDSLMKKLFKNSRYRYPGNPITDQTYGRGLRMRPSAAKTVLDDRIYADQPKYIIVERNSRSSSEDDPFYISRGKKKNNLELFKEARDRRGAIEQLVKSVRNDPYYIARGKKDLKNSSNNNDLLMKEELNRAKELMCARVHTILAKNGYNNRTRRDVPDSERDRRTILKKLAAQLQIDPYFVSRGKRSGDSYNDNENILDFINEISSKCH